MRIGALAMTASLLALANMAAHAVAQNAKAEAWAAAIAIAKDDAASNPPSSSSAVVAAAEAAADAAEAVAEDDSDEDLDAMLSRMFSFSSRAEGAELEAIEEGASEFPLGSRENPVRAEGPPGQRAYLARLRCSNGRRPEFGRMGSAGMSPYGNIVDIYRVECRGGEPAVSEVFIDMYHRGHRETRAVPGFTIE